MKEVNYLLLKWHHNECNYFLVTFTLRKCDIITEISRNSVSVGKFQNSTGGRTDTMTRIFQHISRGRKGNPEVPLSCYLHSVSIPLLVCCGWSCVMCHTHSHTQAHNRALTCANHEIKRAINNQRALSVRVLMRSHVWMQPHVPRHIQ